MPAPSHKWMLSGEVEHAGVKHSCVCLCVNSMSVNQQLTPGQLLETFSVFSQRVSCLASLQRREEREDALLLLTFSPHCLSLWEEKEKLDFRLPLLKTVKTAKAILTNVFKKLA